MLRAAVLQRVQCELIVSPAVASLRQSRTSFAHWYPQAGPGQAKDDSKPLMAVHVSGLQPAHDDPNRSVPPEDPQSPSSSSLSACCSIPQPHLRKSALQMLPRCVLTRDQVLVCEQHLSQLGKPCLNTCPHATPVPALTSADEAEYRRLGASSQLGCVRNGGRPCDSSCQPHGTP